MFQNRLYNQAAYFYIQAMEKYVKEHIATKINIVNPYYAEKLRSLGHSLEKSIQFLLEIYANGDRFLRSQMEHQLLNTVLKGIRLDSLHNWVRYPSYHSMYSSYSMLRISEEDCKILVSALNGLQSYLKDIGRR